MFNGLTLDELTELGVRLRGAMLRFESTPEVRQELTSLYVEVCDQIWLEEFYALQEAEAEAGFSL